MFLSYRSKLELLAEASGWPSIIRYNCNLFISLMLVLLKNRVSFLLFSQAIHIPNPEVHLVGLNIMFSSDLSG